MLPFIKQDIVKVLRDAERYLSEGDIARLKELSNHTIHNCAIFQDQDSITIAVVIYSLYKICQAGAGTGSMLNLIRPAREHIEAEEVGKYNSAIRKITDVIAKIDSKYRSYIQDVINEAQIKKGSRIYYHGISMAQAAELLGVSQWDLMTYLGKTRIPESFADVQDVGRRLKFARSLFS